MPAHVGLVTLVTLYDFVKRVRPRKVRELAGSREAEVLRTASEGELRAIALAYGALPSLTLRMLTVEDVCSGGGGWTFASGEDFAVACTLRVRAYYSTTEDMDAVLEDILTEGDTPGSRIVFSHDNEPLVTPDSGRLYGRGQTVAWDLPACPVEEVAARTRACDPPLYRCLCEGDHATVADIRNAHGRVVRLGLHAVRYFRVDR
ncbi:hypothetical protein ACGFZA_07245 [Streptomyces sp. NPDC048211]|uniref:hypothetical protein n=1 Tax=Streptomyces sp. NPDC048211 TaxID=3365516 RepID=UPI00371CD5F9